MTLDASPAVRSIPARRTILTTAAWSIPVIAAAVATPARAASTTVAVDCQVTNGSWSVPGGNLYADGSQGIPAGNGGNYTTGWTPTKPGIWNGSSTEQDGGHATTDWWNGTSRPGGSSPVGFMSMDDRDNRAEASDEPLQVVTTFVLQGVSGFTYELDLPVYVGATYLGQQYVTIDAVGPGISETIAQGAAGAASITAVPTAYAGYAPLGDVQVFNASLTPTSTGPITLTYTFVMPKVTGGARQNADIWVQTPQVANCPASTS